MQSQINTVKFACPNCDQNLEIDKEAAGERIDCPQCGLEIQVPYLRPAVPRKNPALQPMRKPKRVLGPGVIFVVMVFLIGGVILWYLQQFYREQQASREASTQVNQKIVSDTTNVGTVEKSVEEVVNTSPKPDEMVQAPEESVKVKNEAEDGNAIMAKLFTAESAAAAKIDNSLSENSFTPVEPVPSLGPREIRRGAAWNVQKATRVNAFQFGGSQSGDEEITDMVARGNERLVVTGWLSSLDGIPQANRVHRLVDEQEGGIYGFVAEFSADGQTCLWFSVFGADVIAPNCLALGPDGSIVIGGGVLGRTKTVAGPESGNFNRTEAVVLKVSVDGSKVEWIREGGPNQEMISDIAVDSQGRVLFLAGSYVRGASAYLLRLNPDGSDSFFPGQPSGREWAIDFDLRGGLFTEEGQVGAYYKKGSSGDGFDYDGPGGWGPVRFILFGIRQNGHIVLMPNDDIVVCGTLQYDFRVKGKKKFPAFDTIVARFKSDGSLIWSTNLYQPNDSVHTPDQKDADMIYNPVNGDLYVLVGQHGSNVYRFKGELVGDTGNLFISWIGQVNAETGALKEGWYWQNSRNTQYTDNGIPQSPPYPKLAGNKASAIDVDHQGNIYFAGNAGAKAFTTPQAWKSWPDDQDSGGNAALTVLSPNLDRILYSSMIMGKQNGGTGVSSLVVTSQGVWLGGKNQSKGFSTLRVPWSSPEFSGSGDAALIQFKFQ